MSLTAISNASAPGDPLQEMILHPLFPSVDSILRSGKHIATELIREHLFLCEHQEVLSLFYDRYHVDFVKAPEGFFYLRPRATSLIARAQLSVLDMLVGKVLCYLYLSPDRLLNQGFLTPSELFEELLALTNPAELFKLTHTKATGSELDHKKLFEKVCTSLNRLRRLGFVQFFSEAERLRITEAIFRFGQDVRDDETLSGLKGLARHGEACILSKEDESNLSAEADASQDLEGASNG